MAMTPEGKVKNKIKQIVSEYGLYSPTYQAGYGKNGTSDALNCIAGAFVAIEAKAAPEDKPTPLQRVYLRKVVESGGIGVVVDADNLDALKQLCKYLYDEPEFNRVTSYEVDRDWRLLRVWFDEPGAARLRSEIPADLPTKKKKVGATT